MASPHDDQRKLLDGLIAGDSKSWVFADCAEKLDEIKTHFRDRVAVTLLVRNLDRPHADMIVTDDDEEAIRSRMEDYLDLT